MSEAAEGTDPEPAGSSGTYGFHWDSNPVCGEFEDEKVLRWPRVTFKRKESPQNKYPHLLVLESEGMSEKKQ